MTMPLIAVAVVLQMSNLAHAPAPEVHLAQREVTRLYRDIGVDLSWTESERVATPVIKIVLMPYETGDLRRNRHTVMGAAVRTEQGTSVAYVFYRQIQSQAGDHGVSAMLVLACAMAHEIGPSCCPGANTRLKD